MAIFLWIWRGIQVLLGLGAKELVEKEVELGVEALEHKIHPLTDSEKEMLKKSEEDIKKGRVIELKLEKPKKKKKKKGKK